MADVDTSWTELRAFLLNSEVESRGRCIAVGFVLDLRLIERLRIRTIGSISVTFLYVDRRSLEVCLSKYNYSRWSRAHTMSRIIQ